MHLLGRHRQKQSVPCCSSNKRNHATTGDKNHIIPRFLNYLETSNRESATAVGGRIEKRQVWHVLKVSEVQKKDEGCLKLRCRNRLH